MKEMLVKLVKEVNEIPSVIRDIMVARADLEKKLSQGLSQGGDEEALRAVRDNLAHTDRELEWLRSRQTAAVATINLLSALIGAGRADDAQVVLAALGKSEQEQAHKPDKENKEKTKDQEELKIGTFTIKEAKPGKSEGTIWAIAVTADNAEYKICAKNGTGKALMEAAGKQAKVKYRPLSGDRLFAVSVEIAG